MNEYVAFEDVLNNVGEYTQEKSGNIKCPFCKKYSFRIYPDNRAKCHNEGCKWNGDAIQFYADYNNISRNEAFNELGIHLKSGKLKLLSKEQTYHEAKESLAKDLEFLAWCRMYFAFYKNDRVNQQIYAEKSDLSQSAFNKILNGNMGNATTWRKTLNVLRQEIDINIFKKDIKKGFHYFYNNIDTNAVKKYRIKKKKTGQPD